MSVLSGLLSHEAHHIMNASAVSTEHVISTEMATNYEPSQDSVSSCARRPTSTLN